MHLPGHRMDRPSRGRHAGTAKRDAGRERDPDTREQKDLSQDL